MKLEKRCFYKNWIYNLTADRQDLNLVKLANGKRMVEIGVAEVHSENGLQSLYSSRAEEYRQSMSMNE